MSLRICIVGNSHVAALKRGWPAVREKYPDTTIDMFGTYGTSFLDLSVSDGKIIADSETSVAYFKLTGGSTEIALDAYDRIVVVGAGARIFTMANVLKTLCPPFMNADLLRGSEGGDRKPVQKLARFYRGQEPSLVSSALMRQTMIARSAKTPAAALIRQIAASSSIPVYHLPAPFPSSTTLALKPKSAISRLVGMGYGPLFSDILWDAAESAVRGMADVIRPPENLLVEGLLTDSIYSTGAARLDEELGEHEDDELLHMNGAYGAVVLQHMLERMAK
ncbi:hypothetical protein [Rhizobium sp. LjRoot254]|uniref:hypothetical protein n=1 Tax=Rhizobium sp. LjRoot254 TaxID=3342297 RepID=UPI003ECF3926